MAACNAKSKAMEVLKEHWNYQLPVDPIAIASALGVEVLKSPSIGVDGAFIEENGRKAIVLREFSNSNRERFTIAHELGHACLGHGFSLRDPSVDYDLTNFNPEERDANYFAAELLMPEPVLRHVVIERKITDLAELCKLFGVSSAALSIKLKSSGLI